MSGTITKLRVAPAHALREVMRPETSAQAARRTIRLAEEIQEMCALEAGIMRAPAVELLSRLWDFRATRVPVTTGEQLFSSFLAEILLTHLQTQAT